MERVGGTTANLWRHSRTVCEASPRCAQCVLRKLRKCDECAYHYQPNQVGVLTTVLIFLLLTESENYIVQCHTGGGSHRGIVGLRYDG